LDVLASTIVHLEKDKDIKRELEEYSTRLSLFIGQLQADLGERNRFNNHRTVKGKGMKMMFCLCCFRMRDYLFSSQ